MLDNYWHKVYYMLMQQHSGQACISMKNAAFEFSKVEV